MNEYLFGMWRRWLNPHSESKRRFQKDGKFDALLALRGSGREIWADEHADEYIKRLRENWD